jgi:transposase
MAAVHVLHLQKALDQMNLQIHHVLSDITGVTGFAIVDAILSGQRDPVELAKLRHPTVRADEETVRKSLVGDFRPEHLFTLKQSLAAYRHYQTMIAEVDQEVQQFLRTLEDQGDSNASPPESKKKRRNRRQHNEPGFDLRSHLFRLCGVDLTEIPGIHVMTAQTILTEIGPDLSRFPTEAAFTYA